MEPSSYDPKKRKKHAGFSLIVVLIISLTGLAVIGVTLQFAVSSGGAARMAGASAVKYNLLQRAVEEGRAKLIEKMDNTDPIPRYVGCDLGDGDKGFPNYWINSMACLLINRDLDDSADTIDGIVKNETIHASALGRLGIFGSGSDGLLTVAIYDMQYEPARVVAPDASPPLPLPTMTETDYKRLPPSIILAKAVWRKDGDILAPDHNDQNATAAGRTGAYLVRATLKIGDRESILDSAILQANNM
ncbi:MAG: hypothetical protein LBU13_05015 [Synergistaceae bacterium]|jgi:hypothetical protein|nr:hypothetical protein [Synergistaceae bacterium]